MDESPIAKKPLDWRSWLPAEGALLAVVDERVVSDSLKCLVEHCCRLLCEGVDFDQVVTCCSVLIDIVWEKLNTGYWKDVDVSWRHLYSVACLLRAVALLTKGENEERLQEALKWCDMGLIMGAPISGNVLAYLASSVHRLLVGDVESIEEDSGTCEDSEASAPFPNPAELNLNVCDAVKRVPVARISCPSVLQFQEMHLTVQTPVIITDAMYSWPALKKWSVPYLLSKIAHRTVPIEIGSKYSDDDWSQKLLPFRQFVDEYVTMHGRVGYLAQHQLFEQIIDLREDIKIPDYCAVLSSPDDVDINAWFGPKGTVSPLHTDPRENIFAQVMGSKYIAMCSPLETSKVYPYESPLLFNTCQVDIEKPDLVKFPKFRDVTLYDCVLRPGELLYIPCKWWHYLRSLETSFSISFWFGQ